MGREKWSRQPGNHLDCRANFAEAGIEVQKGCSVCPKPVTRVCQGWVWSAVEAWKLPDAFIH